MSHVFKSYVFKVGDVVEMVTPRSAHVDEGLKVGVKAVIAHVDSQNYVTLKNPSRGRTIGCLTYRLKPVQDEVPAQGELFDTYYSQ